MDVSNQTAPVRALRSRRELRGFTLIEVLLAGAVGAAIIIAAAMFFIQANNAAKRDAAFQQLQAVIGNVRSLHSGQPDYQGLTTEIAIKARVFPPSMVRDPNASSAKAINPFGGSVLVEAGATPDVFELTFERVPPDACVALVSTNTASIGGSVERITVDGAALSLPISVADATARCNSNSSGLVTITWTVH